MKVHPSSIIRKLIIFCFSLMLCGCNFHLQGEIPLAPALHQMYFQTSDPYGYLSKSLEQYLKMSKVQLVSSPAEARTILIISNDSTAQDLLSVGGTQQTRQYKLSVFVTFEITDTKGMTIVAPQTVTESRVITVQSNQILGSSNEANLYYQQMRRGIAYAIMNRIASKSITQLINDAFPTKPERKKP